MYFYELHHLLPHRRSRAQRTLLLVSVTDLANSCAGLTNPFAGLLPGVPPPSVLGTRLGS